VYYDDIDTGESQSSVDWLGMNLDFSLPEPNTRNSDFTLHVTYEIDNQPYYQNLDFDKEFHPQGPQGKFSVTLPDPPDDSLFMFRNNDDEIFQTSEEIRIRPLLKNDGLAEATHIDVVLLYEGKELRVDQSYESYPDLSPKESAYPAGDFWIDSNVFSFSGTEYLDVRVEYDQGEPVEIPNAIAITVVPAPVIGVDDSNWDFGVIDPGDDASATLRVRNSGSGVLNVTNVYSNDADTSVQLIDRDFLLNYGTYKDIVVTIDTSNIPNGTTISRQIIVASDGRLGDDTPPSNRMTISGLVSSSTPVLQAPIHTRHGDPDISGDWIVWTENRSGDLDIFAYNIMTNEERLITDAAGDQHKPRISGDLIVWQDYRNYSDDSQNVDIYGYNLISGQEFAVSTHPSSEGLIGIANGKVAFARNDFTWPSWDESTYHGNNIYYYNISLNTTNRITNYNASNPGSPLVFASMGEGDFSDDTITWENQEHRWLGGQDDWERSEYQIIMKYKIGGDTAPVKIDDENSGYSIDSAPVTSNNRIAWIGENSIINSSHKQAFVWDNGNKTQITTEETDHSDIVMGDNFIIYQKFSATGMFYWSLDDNKEYLLSDQLLRTEQSRMDGRSVVWEGKDSDSQWHIYYAFLQHPDIAVASANLSFSDTNPKEGDVIEVSILAQNLTDFNLADNILDSHKFSRLFSC